MGWYSCYQHLQMKEIRLSKLTWGEGNGNPLHNSCLGTPWTKEPGGLLSISSHRVGHNWSDLACTHAMEKEMAIDATVLAWRTSGREEPGELLSMGLQSWTWLKRLSSNSSSSKLTWLAQSHQFTWSISWVWLFVTPWITVCQASLSITNSQSSSKLMSIESVIPSIHLILCHPLLLLPPGPPSIRVFSNESTLRMRWPKHWSFNFSIIPSKEIPGLISFRMDWLDLLAVQGTL